VSTELIPVNITTRLTVGSITTDAAALLEAVRKGVAKYHDADYVPDEKAAKTDRAALNALARKVDDARKDIERQWNAPLEDFKATCKEIVTTVKGAVEEVDGCVKAYEEEQKARKRTLIENYFAGKGFDLVPLERLWNPKWLNKTYKYEDICQDIDDEIVSIYKGVERMEGNYQFTGHAAEAKAFYLETLTIDGACNKMDAYLDALKAQEREAAGRHERKEAEAERELAELEAVPIQETIARQEAEAQRLVDEALDEEVREASQKRSLLFCLLFHTPECENPEAAARTLKTWMIANGFTYDKINLEDYVLKAEMEGF